MTSAWTHNENNSKNLSAVLMMSGESQTSSYKFDLGPSKYLHSNSNASPATKFNNEFNSEHIGPCATPIPEPSNLTDELLSSGCPFDESDLFDPFKSNFFSYL